MNTIDKVLAIIVVSETAYFFITRVLNARGPTVSLTQAMPFVGTVGHSTLFNLCALAIFVITIWGIFRVSSKKNEE